MARSECGNRAASGRRNRSNSCTSYMRRIVQGTRSKYSGCSRRTASTRCIPSIRANGSIPYNRCMKRNSASGRATSSRYRMSSRCNACSAHMRGSRNSARICQRICRESLRACDTSFRIRGGPWMSIYYGAWVFSLRRINNTRLLASSRVCGSSASSSRRRRRASSTARRFGSSLSSSSVRVANASRMRSSSECSRSLSITSCSKGKENPALTYASAHFDIVARPSAARSLVRSLFASEWRGSTSFAKGRVTIFGGGFAGSLSTGGAIFGANNASSAARL